jgi:PQQ system protein
MQQEQLQRLRNIGKAAILIGAMAIGGCAKMQMMETMAKTNEPNERMLGQMFVVGGGKEAVRGDDGVARVTVKHFPEETIFRPSVITMEEPGELEVTFENNNPHNHLMVIVPSYGSREVVDLPPLATGKARVRLGTPGLYMFIDAMGNHMGRGMMGMISVAGEVPEAAKLDRPTQPRP